MNAYCTTTVHGMGSEDHIITVSIADGRTYFRPMLAQHFLVFKFSNEHVYWIWTWVDCSAFIPAYTRFIPNSQRSCDLRGYSPGCRIAYTLFWTALSQYFTVKVTSSYKLIDLPSAAEGSTWAESRSCYPGHIKKQKCDWMQSSNTVISVFFKKKVASCSMHGKLVFLKYCQCIRYSCCQV